MPLASIPSPPTNVLQLGPLELHYYGLVIAIGVALAFSITRRRWEDRGGDGEFLERVMVWAVGLGFLGARTGYVITNTDRFFGADAPLDPWQVIAIWEGGLALYGGLIGGTLTAWWFLRGHRPGLLSFLDSAAVAVPVAQMLGRLGNWFNQELFGTPTDLPWGLEIDPGRRPAEFADSATFHPTFLYEIVWNLLVVGVLLRLDRRGTFRRRGSLGLLYFALYAVGRFLTELLRTDTDFRIIGLSRNALISIAIMVVAGVVLARRESEPDAQDPAWLEAPRSPGSDDEDEDEDGNAAPDAAGDNDPVAAGVGPEPDVGAEPDEATPSPDADDPGTEGAPGSRT